jgi:hypothetical protein
MITAQASAFVAKLRESVWPSRRTRTSQNFPLSRIDATEPLPCSRWSKFGAILTIQGTEIEAIDKYYYYQCHTLVGGTGIEPVTPAV